MKKLIILLIICASCAKSNTAYYDKHTAEDMKNKRDKDKATEKRWEPYKKVVAGSIGILFIVGIIGLMTDDND